MNERRAPLKTPVWEARSAFALWRELVSVNAARRLMKSQPTAFRGFSVSHMLVDKTAGFGCRRFMSKLTSKVFFCNRNLQSQSQSRCLNFYHNLKITHR